MSINMHQSLKDCLVEERNAYPDKTGMTPLIRRAFYFKNLNQTNAEKIEEIKVVRALVKQLNDIKEEDYNHLFSYIEIAYLYNESLKRSLENILYTSWNGENEDQKTEQKEALKHLYIIQFLKQIDEFSITQSLIEQQHLIKRYFPWNYAELLTDFSLELGTEYIKELFRHKVQYSIIYNNRDTWLRKFGPENFIEYILPLSTFLSEEDKQDLKLYCKELNIYSRNTLISQSLSGGAQSDNRVMTFLNEPTSMGYHVHDIQEVYDKTFSALVRARDNSKKDKKTKLIESGKRPDMWDQKPEIVDKFLTPIFDSDRLLKIATIPIPR